MSFQMKWDPVQGYINPQQFKTDSYGNILKDVQAGINAFADQRRAENTQQALLDVARINSTKDLAGQQVDLNTMIDVGGTTLNQGAILDAINARETLLKDRELGERTKATTADLSRMSLNGATLADIQKAGLTAAPDQLAAYAKAADDNRAATLAAENRKHKMQMDAIDAADKSSQIVMRDKDYQVKVAELAAKNPDAVTTVDRYNPDTGRYESVQIVKPGFGTTLNGISGVGYTTPDPRFVKYQGQVSPVTLGMIAPESTGNHVDPKTGKLTASPAGAQGLTQFIPSTRNYIMKKYGVDAYKDEASAIKAADLYHKENLATFKGDEAKAIAAYNAGPGKVQSAVKKATDAGNPGNWLSYMPKETQKHVPKVLASARVYGYGGNAGPLSQASGRTGEVSNPFSTDRAGKGNKVFELPGGTLDNSRKVLQAAVQQAQVADNITRGTADYTQATYDYKAYVKQNDVAGSKVYRTLYSDPAYIKLDPVTKLAVLKATVQYDKDNTPMFSFGANAKDIKAYADTQIKAIEQKRTAAQRAGILKQFSAEATKILPEAQKSNPNVTLDDVMKSLNPTLYKELGRATAKAKQHM